MHGRTHTCCILEICPCTLQLQDEQKSSDGETEDQNDKQNEEEDEQKHQQSSDEQDEHEGEKGSEDSCYEFSMTETTILEVVMDSMRTCGLALALQALSTVLLGKTTASCGSQHGHLLPSSVHCRVNYLPYRHLSVSL